MPGALLHDATRSPVREMIGCSLAARGRKRGLMALTFLCAGCSQAERDEAEATVRAALGDRFRAAPWVVSLVRVGEQWSVTMNGPGLRALSFAAPGPRLGESILERLVPGPRALPPEEKPSHDLARDRHECDKCQRPFVVAYEVQVDEAQEAVPIACPHCWQMNEVLVAEAAAYTQAFKAEKLET